VNIIRTWNFLSKFPGGPFIFNKYLGYLIPYSGSISARVIELSSGSSRIELRERRAVRNHLGSVHAVALMNLGELASGLALITSIPQDARAILVKYSINFIKKARGTLTAQSRCDRILSADPRDIELGAEIRNEQGEKVAQVTATWKVGPKK
jgi:acyl-coenzyme A thioesterase PaaI-like protein